RPDPRVLHRFEEEHDVRERVGEDMVVIEGLLLFRVDRVVHRAHVQRGHFRFQVADVRDTLIRRDTDCAGREVDDDMGSRPYLAEDLGERLDIPIRAALRVARVDVPDRRTRGGRPLRLLADLFWGVWDGGTLGPRCQHAGEGGGDYDLVPQTGMFPCFRHGRPTVFSLACSSPRMMTRRVSAGSMTSSIIAQPAARYGLICARID